MTGCWICLDEAAPDERYHRACLIRLFGTATCPAIDLRSSSIAEAIAKQSDRISISGVQEKLIVDLLARGKTIGPSENGRYILKVPVAAYKHLPENEHLTMTLAAAAGIPAPVCGLLSLPQGETAYVVKRFDRADNRAKRRQEDFCSLLQRDPALKYQSSAEECIDVVRRYSADAEGDLRHLFLQFLFAFWIGNDDLHLKNLSLAQTSAGGYRLSPVYDMVCTRLYPQLKKGMALPLDDRTLHHRRKNFVSFAQRCGISEKEAAAALSRLRDARAGTLAAIGRSALPAGFKLSYKRELEKKNRALA